MTKKQYQAEMKRDRAKMKAKMEESTLPIWENNNIQFPRLLSEIAGIVVISKKDMKALCESMDLTRDEINELFDRADAVFQKIKAKS